VDMCTNGHMDIWIQGHVDIWTCDIWTIDIWRYKDIRTIEIVIVGEYFLIICMVCFIPFVIIRFVCLYVWRYTFCLFISFVVIRFVIICFVFLYI
jgi:hypothetical protein